MFRPLVLHSRHVGAVILSFDMVIVLPYNLSELPSNMYRLGIGRKGPLLCMSEKCSKPA